MLSGGNVDNLLIGDACDARLRQRTDESPPRVWVRLGAGPPARLHYGIRNYMRTALCLSLVAAAALAQNPKPSGLDRLIEAELSRFPAKTGL